jgi:hypothetical protein
MTIRPSRSVDPRPVRSLLLPLALAGALAASACASPAAPAPTAASAGSPTTSARAAAAPASSPAAVPAASPATAAAAAAPATAPSPGAAAAAAPTQKVNANTASRAEIQRALEAAGVANAARWAREVEEYRPYPANDGSFAKLRQELAKYNPGPGVVDQIVAALAL